MDETHDDPLKNPQPGARSGFEVWAPWFLAIAAAAVTIYFVVFGIGTAESGSRTKVKSIEFNQPVQIAIENNGHTTRAVMQMTIGLLAVLGGVLVAKPEEGKLLLGRRPECCMFVLCAGSFLISLYLFLDYSEKLTSACGSAVPRGEKTKAAETSGEPNKKDELSDSGKDSTYLIPNVFEARIEHTFTLQRSFFISGVIVMLFMFVSAHGIKRSQE